MQDLICFKAA